MYVRTQVPPGTPCSLPIAYWSSAFWPSRRWLVSPAGRSGHRQLLSKVAIPDARNGALLAPLTWSIGKCWICIWKNGGDIRVQQDNIEKPRSQVLEASIITHCECMYCHKSPFNFTSTEQGFRRPFFFPLFCGIILVWMYAETGRCCQST
jgi:hypothetical protein